jgi:hypothetical protein
VIVVVKYPYIPSMPPIKRFLQSIQTMGIPEKVNQNTLPQMGFKSSNDRYIPSILKFIGFIDSSGVPTEDYKEFRKKEVSKSVMANALRRTYADLFILYPDANNKDFQPLRDFFSGTTKAGEHALGLTVQTFKTLCEFADFGAVPAQVEPQQTQPTPKPLVQLPITREGGVNINVNIRFELPITKDPDIYDKIFESLKKHLLAPSSKTD